MTVPVSLGMPELPPRDQRDPVVLSNSSIQVFKDCKRKFWLTYYRRLRPRTQKMSGALALGSRVHKALELYYAEVFLHGAATADLMAIWATLVDDDRTVLHAEGRHTDDFDNEAELGRIMLEGYLEWVEDEGIDSQYDIVSQEETLKHPMLGGQVLLVAKLDQRVKRKVDGVRMIRDFKPLLATERVATPGGWTPIGDLVVGDAVLGSNFLPTTVTGVFDRPGSEDVFRVSFNDGTSVVATADHPWLARRVFGRPAVVETKDLATGKSPHVIDPVEPVDGPDAALPVHPYVLGAWLGDGCRYTGRGRGARWTNKSDDDRVWRMPIGVSEKSVALRLSDLTGAPVKVTSPSEGRSYTTDFFTVSPPIGIDLEALGLHDKKSPERFIPIGYLRASRSQRLELLRGLMDTDGQVNTHSNSVAYVTTSPALAADVADLVRSLGGWAKPVRAVRPAKYRVAGGGYRETGTHLWRVTVRLDDLPFGAHERRIVRWNEATENSTRPRSKGKRVVSVTREGAGRVRCISIGAADHLFVTEGTTLTHNTSANFNDLMKTAQMNEQFLTYMILEALQKGEMERVEGAIITALKKVKRTASARPPFYSQVEVQHNVFTLRNYAKRLDGELTDIVEMWRALEEGADPQVVAYPHPTRDCSWKCEFQAVCPMFDDGSAVERALHDQFEVGSAFDYYGDSDPTKAHGGVSPAPAT